MVFSSLIFLFRFLPVFLIIYYLVPFKFKNPVLFAGSIAFYAWGEPRYLVLVLFSILINYSLARMMCSYEKGSLQRKLMFLLAIFYDVGMLLVFKYLVFILKSINELTGLNIGVPAITLPLGISFYTFQVLSYIIDIYRKKIKIQKNIIDLATYIALFPQLIAGPIVQYKDIEKQLRHRKESLDLFIAGSKRFVLGLAKKVIIANNVAIIADTLYAQPVAEVSTPGLWLAALAYTLQIYFDFSGYSDMAIGLGKMFGFEFSENFNYPYIATSIKDFWRRWHISLSTWFRDYVYIPLGGNRVSEWKWARNIIVVWLLTGIWHGANWNFIIWGLFYGFLLLIEGTLLSKVLNKLPRLFRYILTMLVVIVGWTIFRVEDLETLGATLGKMFGINASFSLSSVFRSSYSLIASLPFIPIGIIFATPCLRKLFVKFEQKASWLVPIKYLIYLAMLVGVFILLVSNSYNPFIYFRF